MSASLRTLLSGAIDYAGMFPPAELSLDQSIRNYLRYRSEPESWMLGRFICPAARLKELTPYLHAPGGNAPISISALGRGGQGLDEFVTGFKRDVEAMRSFQQEMAGRAVIDVIETRIPEGAALSMRPDDLTVFIETTVSGDWRRSILAGVAAASVAPRWGFKLRSGGVEPSAFPPSEQIAFAIAACRDRKVPLKFTAGLHHPMRHFNKSVQAKMHGFINVLAAGVLAHAGNLSEDRLVPILEEEDARSFGFDDQTMRWKDLRATTGQIRSVRQQFIISFGSCSFDEPRDDLRAIGWL